MNLYTLFQACLNAPYKKVGQSANYAVIKNGKDLYIFFEGSDGQIDWKNNLDFPAKAYKRNCKTIWRAHRGFLRVWKEIEPYIASIIADRTIKNITIAGYSHGGAIAVLCHEYVWFNRPDIRENLFGYGFGAPRVFWGLYKKQLSKRWENFTVVKNINDLVTRLPPVVLGYRHVGTLLQIGVKGKYSDISAHLSSNILTELKEYEKNKK